MRKKLPRYVVSLDVETVGLHGQPFAWAAVVKDTETMKTVAEIITACPMEIAMGPAPDREWVAENVVPALETPPDPDPDCGQPVYRQVGTVEALLFAFVVFWNAWSVKKGGCWLLVDHGYPVEAEFLFECFMESFGAEHKPELFRVPYPVIDYASMRAAILEDPVETLPRYASEIPIHNPLADARQTIRLAFAHWAFQATFYLPEDVEIPERDDDGHDGKDQLRNQ